MSSDNNIAKRDFVIELMKSTGKDDLNYIYRGEFTQNLQQHILSLAEKNIDRDRISGKIKKRIFHIMHYYEKSRYEKSRNRNSLQRYN